MSFSNPSFLYLLFFALIPIILYFFNLQKVHRVEFSNIELLENLKEKTSNRFQIKRLLIMILRVLAVIFIVFAFAKPTFKSTEKYDNVHHVIFLDNSLSMTRKIDASLLLDKAKSVVSSITESKKGDKFSFITHNNLEINRDYYNQKEFLKAISQVKASTGSLDQNQLVSLLRRKKSDLKKKYYFISDFQASTFDLDAFKETISDSKQNMVLCKMDASKENCFIDSVWIDDKYLVAGNKVKVNFRLNNQSNDDKELLIKCLVKENQLGSKVVKVESNSKTVSEIEFQLTAKGFNDLCLRIDDPLVEFDNDYYFVLESNRNIKVLIVKGNSKSYFEIAYKNEPLFLVKSYEESRLNSSELAQNDLIVLDGLQNLNKLPVQQLKTFVDQGGKLVITPNATQDVNELKQFLSNVGLQNSIIASATKEKEEVDMIQLVKSEWFKKQFQSTDVKMQTVNYNPLFDVNGAEMLIKSRKGRAFLSVLKSKGSGEAILFNFPMNESNSNFTRHSLFVVTAYELAMNSVMINKNLSFEIGSADLTINGVNPDKSAQYSLVSNIKKYLPAQQVMGKNLVLSLFNDEEAGVYSIQNGNDALTRIGLNFSRKESNFDALDLSSLNNNDNIDVQNWDATKSYLADDSEIGFGAWKWWVLIALICLLLETSLIRFYK